MGDIDNIIDLQRYPFDRPGDAGYRELVEQGRATLDASALFALPGFIRAGVAEQMAQEIDALVPVAARYDRPRIAYACDPPRQDWPEDHPRRQVHPSAYHQVLNFQIPNGARLGQVYFWQPLTEFLGELCGYASFYRSERPTWR